MSIGVVLLLTVICTACSVPILMANLYTTRLIANEVATDIFTAVFLAIWAVPMCVTNLQALRIITIVVTIIIYFAILRAVGNQESSVTIYS